MRDACPLGFAHRLLLRVCAAFLTRSNDLRHQGQSRGSQSQDLHTAPLFPSPLGQMFIIDSTEIRRNLGGGVKRAPQCRFAINPDTKGFEPFEATQGSPGVVVCLDLRFSDLLSYPTRHFSNSTLANTEPLHKRLKLVAIRCYLRFQRA